MLSSCKLIIRTHVNVSSEIYIIDIIYRTQPTLCQPPSSSTVLQRTLIVLPTNAMASSPLSLEGVDRSSINVPQIVIKWLSAFETRLIDKIYTELEKLFLEDSWWRDTLALS